MKLRELRFGTPEFASFLRSLPRGGGADRRVMRGVARILRAVQAEGDAALRRFTEELDGVVYQEVPQPSLARHDTVGPAAEYGYLGTPGVNVFPSSGHLRVSVAPDQLRVEYVRSVPARDETASLRNGSIAHAYTVRR